MKLLPPECLAAVTIRGEADGEPYEGKVAVAEVIRERMARRYHSDGTVAGTVLAPMQFSLFNAHDPGRIRACNAEADDPLTIEALKAWAESEAGLLLPPGAVLYHAKGMPQYPDWATAATVRLAKTIGRHLFYIDTAALRG